MSIVIIEWPQTEESRVAVVVLDRGQNRFNEDLVKQLNVAWDELENAGEERVRCVVITGKAKFFSNGLDLDWISQQSPAVRRDFFVQMFALLARIQASGLYVVAAINGHAFGAGLFLSLVCDYRVMRSDRGFLCFPEVHIGLPLSAPFKAIAMAKLSASALRTGVLTGKRWKAGEALRQGLVDAVAPGAKVKAVAMQMADALAMAKTAKLAVSTLKAELYEDMLRALRSRSAGNVESKL